MFQIFQNVLKELVFSVFNKIKNFIKKYYTVLLYIFFCFLLFASFKVMYFDYNIKENLSTKIVFSNNCWQIKDNEEKIIYDFSFDYITSFETPNENDTWNYIVKDNEKIAMIKKNNIIFEQIIRDNTIILNCYHSQGEKINFRYIMKLNKNNIISYNDKLYNEIKDKFHWFGYYKPYSKSESILEMLIFNVDDLFCSKFKMNDEIYLISKKLITNESIVINALYTNRTYKYLMNKKLNEKFKNITSLVKSNFFSISAYNFVLSKYSKAFYKYFELQDDVSYEVFSFLFSIILFFLLLVFLLIKFFKNMILKHKVEKIIKNFPEAVKKSNREDLYEKYKIWYIISHEQDFDNLLFFALPNYFFSLIIDIVKHKLSLMFFHNLFFLCFIYAGLLYIYNKILNKTFAFVPSLIINLFVFKLMIGIYTLYILIAWYFLCTLLILLIKFFDPIEVEI